MVPTVQLGSWIRPIIIMIGLFMAPSTGTSIAWAGLFLFAGTVAFVFISLPVEYDASRRAKQWLSNSDMIYREEMNRINSVLDAAALTYVAGAIQAIFTLLYYAFLLSGRSRND